MPPDLPRPRSQLPLLKDFSLPLPNTDEFYFSGQLWDPTTRQPLLNSFGLAPTKGKKMPPKSKAETTTKTKRKKKDAEPLEPLRSSQVDQLASDSEEQPIPSPKKKPKKEPKKKKAAVKLIVQTEPSTSKASTSKQRKVERSPSPPAVTTGGLERFRCPIKGDGTPSSDVMNQSELPLKRARPPKEISKPQRSTSRDRSDEEEETTEKQKKKQKKNEKGKERAKSLEKKPKAEEDGRLLYLQELDEDGNVVEAANSNHSPANSQQLTPSRSPSPSPRGSHSPSRSPLRPISPSKRTSTVPSSASKRSRPPTIPLFRPPLRSSSPPPNQQKSSPFRPPRAQVGIGESRKSNSPPALPSSSPSNVLPSQMAQRIRSSHEYETDRSPSPSRAGRPELEVDPDATLVDTDPVEEEKNRAADKAEVTSQPRRSGLTAAEQNQVDELMQGLEEDDFGGFDASDGTSIEEEGADQTWVNDSRVEDEEEKEKDDFVPSRSASPRRSSRNPSPHLPPKNISCPPEFLPSQQPSKHASPSLSDRLSSCTSSKDHATTASTSLATTGSSKPFTFPSFPTSHPQFLSSAALPSSLDRPKPAPTHKLVPLNLKGVTTMMQELLESALNSSQPLSQFGFTDPNDSAHGGNAGGGRGSNEFGRGEIGYLRREVDRLTSELVERDQTILSLSEKLRSEALGKEQLRTELNELDEMLKGVEEERDREKERVGWMKEAKKGLLRELRELEERCEMLEKALQGQDGDQESREIAEGDTEAAEQVHNENEQIDVVSS
ncbi:hypothetical protein JCM5350_002065 [Sporobolomyces pararoseus]